MQIDRTLRFCYRMSLGFSEPVQKHQFALRMIPQSDMRQQIVDCKVVLEPACALKEGVDSFGNRYVYGEIVHPHSAFCVEVRGTARTAGGIAVLCEIPVMSLAPYRFASQYTRAGDALKAYYGQNGQRAGEDDYAFAARLNHQIYQDMVYKQGVTDIHTTAEEAFSDRRGVCQDYAHIMLALCRMADIPSRYVVGMIEGEGYSHAWVEICADQRWYGMDPTNDKMTDGTYIKISHGRDYQDCIVNRGTFRGTGTQTQQVSIVVSEE